ARARELRAEDELLDGPRAERNHDVDLDLPGVELVPLLALRARNDAERLAAANDRSLLHPVLRLEVPRDDRVTRLVIRDGALVVGAHLRDRLLEAEEPHVRCGQPVLIAEL